MERASLSAAAPDRATIIANKLHCSLQGSMEGVKLSQCDFVAVAHGVYAEHCLQMNVNNSHINATHCCIYACNVNQSSFSNLLLYKVRFAFVLHCKAQSRTCQR
jgi:hypothetical protein